LCLKKSQARHYLTKFENSAAKEDHTGLKRISKIKVFLKMSHGVFLLTRNRETEFMSSTGDSYVVNKKKDTYHT